MSKSILVIDTPKACIDCPCHFCIDSGIMWCGQEKRKLEADDIEIYKPDWCPLKEVQKKEATSLMLASRAFVGGYNKCIDEILKEGD